MDHKKVIKQTLYSFVEKKVKLQKAEVRKEISALINTAVDPILNDWIQVDSLELDASNLADRLTEVIEKYPSAVSWGVKNIVRDLNGPIRSLGETMKDHIKGIIRNYVEFPTNGEVKFKQEPLRLVTLQLQKDAAPFYKKITDLSTLENELNRVIGAEANGAKAYKALVALGVDLSEIEDVSPNLPAIVKLSVDPSLLAQA
ncbi:hypothetical protein BSK49_01065 [Paenibacillus odorifer]|uniref:hypothetical protein n=1 Tax=Paenibacillus TaxID=44249 RepID=UPI00096BECD3|nr:hypothetical protein [Paenibacillus odorifer]OMD93004.1 hypothetical protein BSK49_01065 [Paenibacillus odorifer]